MYVIVHAQVWLLMSPSRMQLPLNNASLALPHIGTADHRIGATDIRTDYRNYVCIGAHRSRRNYPHFSPALFYSMIRWNYDLQSQSTYRSTDTDPDTRRQLIGTSRKREPVSDPLRHQRIGNAPKVVIFQDVTGPRLVKTAIAMAIQVIYNAF